MLLVMLGSALLAVGGVASFALVGRWVERRTETSLCANA